MAERLVIATLRPAKTLWRAILCSIGVLWMAVMCGGLIVEGLVEKRYFALVGAAVAAIFGIAFARYTFGLLTGLLSPGRAALYVQDGFLVHLSRRFWSIRLDGIASVRSISDPRGVTVIDITDRKDRSHEVHADLLLEKVSPTIAAIQAARRAASNGMA